MHRPARLVCLLALALPRPALAQDVAESIRLGVESQLARDPSTALAHLEVALAADPKN